MSGTINKVKAFNKPIYNNLALPLAHLPHGRNDALQAHENLPWYVLFDFHK